MKDQANILLQPKDFLPQWIDIKYALKHEWNKKELSEIAEQIQERRLLERFTEQHLNYVNLPRVLLLANLWGNLYLPAKYGFESGYLTAAKDLFRKEEAALAVEHARECYDVAYWSRYLSEEQLAALLQSPK